MTGGLWAIVGAIVLGLAINECGEVSPWLADKVVTWAARVRWPDSVEEKRRHIVDRPGKLLKLITACGFGCVAIGHLLAKREKPTRRFSWMRFRIGLLSALIAGAVLVAAGVIAQPILGEQVARDAVTLAALFGPLTFISTVVAIVFAVWFPIWLTSGGTVFVAMVILLVLDDRGSNVGEMLLKFAYVSGVIGVCVGIAVNAQRVVKPNVLFGLLSLGCTAHAVVFLGRASEYTVDTGDVEKMANINFLCIAVGCAVALGVVMTQVMTTKLAVRPFSRV